MVLSAKMAEQENGNAVKIVFNPLIMKQNRRILATIVIVVVATLLAASCCNRKKAEDQRPAAVPEETSLLTAIDDYFIKEIASHYEPAPYSVPFHNFLAVDDTDPQDILVWGDFWLMNYDLKGTTLLTRSGGNYPGLFHLAKTDDGFKVTEAKFVEDGERNGESVKEIFGVDDELLAAYNAASYDFNDCLLNSVMIYREANGTEIKAYEDYGWDPVTLDFDEELIIDYPDLQGSWTADGITAEIVNPKEGCVYYVVLTDSRDAEKPLTYEIYGQYEHSTDTVYYWNGWVKDEAGNDLDTNAEGELAVGEDGSLTWTNGSEEPVVLTK